MPQCDPEHRLKKQQLETSALVKTAIYRFSKLDQHQIAQTQRKLHIGSHHSQNAKSEDREERLKMVKEKSHLTCRGALIYLIDAFCSEQWRPENIRMMQSDAERKKKLSTKNSMPSRSSS